MFGFEKKRGPHEVPAELLDIRDCLMRIVGSAIDIYSATPVGCLTKSVKTTEGDVKQELKKMLVCLQKYVCSEILVERARNGGRVTPEDLAELRVYRLPASYGQSAGSAVHGWSGSGSRI